MLDVNPVVNAIRSFRLDEKVMARVFHGRGRTYPGFEQVTVDWYPPAFFICLFKPVDEHWLEELIESVWQNKAEQVKSIVVQKRHGVNTIAQVVKGAPLPEPHIVEESNSPNEINLKINQDTHNLQDSMTIEDTHYLACKELKEEHSRIKFYVQLCNAQNVGIFPDMINGRSWVRDNSQDKNVLNLFSYTCLFSVAAMQGGASGVVNVDMNKSVMSQGRKNHQLNAIDTREVKFFSHNIFNSWGKIKRNGPYELIIIDPPTFQKGSFTLTKDYQKLIRRLPELATATAQVMLCVNSPDLGTDFLMEQVREHCPELKFVMRLGNHQNFPELDEECSLKVMLFRF